MDKRQQEQEQLEQELQEYREQIEKEKRELKQKQLGVLLQSHEMNEIETKERQIYIRSGIMLSFMLMVKQVMKRGYMPKVLHNPLESVQQQTTRTLFRTYFIGNHALFTFTLVTALSSYYQLEQTRFNIYQAHKPLVNKYQQLYQQHLVSTLFKNNTHK